MKRFFGQKKQNNIIFENGEASHIRQVLRLHVGDAICGIVGDNNEYDCTITEISKASVVARVDRVRLCPALPQKQITLFIAMPKREYFETIITKATELGVSQIVPFISKFSVNHSFKRERAEQILLTAVKQCELSKMPKLTDPTAFNEMLNQLKDYDAIVFANETEEKPFKLESLNKYNKIAVIVGCEGGFEKTEIEKIKNAGAKSISLGARILRCDTASIATLSLVSILSGN